MFLPNEFDSIDPRHFPKNHKNLPTLNSSFLTHLYRLSNSKIIDLVEKENPKLFEIVGNIRDQELLKYICSMYSILPTEFNYYVEDRFIELYGFNKMILDNVNIQIYEGFSEMKLIYSLENDNYQIYYPKQNCYSDFTEYVPLHEILDNKYCAFI